MQALFSDLLRKLTLHSLKAPSRAGKIEHMETSVLAVGGSFYTLYAMQSCGCSQ